MARVGAIRIVGGVPSAPAKRSRAIESSIARLDEQLRAIRRERMPRTERHVMPADDGGWNVLAPGARRPSSHHSTQAQAVARARQIVHNAGGGKVVTHRRDGRIRCADDIAASRNVPRRVTG